MPTEQCLLPLLIIIGVCQANGVRQRQLDSSYGDDSDGLPRRQLHSSYGDGANTPQYAYQTQDGDPGLRLDEDMTPPPGMDGSDARKFLLLSHDTKPNSDKYKLSELAFFGLGPDAFVKKETDESGNGQTLSAGIEYFGMPLTQISSSNKKEEKEDGSIVDIHTLEKGLEFFGLPLGKIKYSNKKETNIYGEESPSDQKAEFELFGIPLGQIPLSGGETEVEYTEYGNQETDTEYYATINQDQQEYQYSQNDFAVKPHLVPVGTMQGYEGGYYRQVVCTPSSSLNGRTPSQSDCQVKLIPVGTVQGYEAGYQQVICPYTISANGRVTQGDCTVNPQVVSRGELGGFEGSLKRPVVTSAPKALKDHIVLSTQHRQTKTQPGKQSNKNKNTNKNSRRVLAPRDGTDLQISDGTEFLQTLTKLFAESVQGLESVNDFFKLFQPLMEYFSEGRSTPKNRPKSRSRSRPRQEDQRVKFRGPVIVG